MRIMIVCRSILCGGWGGAVGSMLALMVATPAWLSPAIAQCRNPVGVELISVHLPRVARSSQPWALRRNPLGIGFRNASL